MNHTPQSLSQYLNELETKRGYLLPHHGALSAALPKIVDDYYSLYRSLIVEHHHLSDFEREFIWMALLALAKEGMGTHHLKKFREAGGNDKQLAAAFRLAAWTHSCSVYEFVTDHWAEQLASTSPAVEYEQASIALLSDKEGISEPLIRLTLLSTQSAMNHPWGIAQEILACYKAGIPEEMMVESICLTLWPFGVNRIIDACSVWVDLFRMNKIDPSPLFRAWLEQPNQDGQKI